VNTCSALSVDNMETFWTNDIYTVLVQDTDMPNTNFSVYQQGVYSARIKFFYNLSPTIKSLKHDIWVFKPEIVAVLSHSYSIQQFASVKNFQL